MEDRMEGQSSISHAPAISPTGENGRTHKRVTSVGLAGDVPSHSSKPLIPNAGRPPTSTWDEGLRANWARQLLVTQPTPLIDRREELESIYTSFVVEGVRLLTLTGPAGVGKTRLALAAAARLASEFVDGVVVVDLARVNDPGLLLPTLSQVLGVSATGGVPLLERLRVFLADRTILLLLDNFEQVLPAANQLVDLLAVCPGIRLLVTSRIPLQLRWEHILRIKPLPVPDLTIPLPSIDELAQIPAVSLFLERARARRADFTLARTQASLVAQLVVHLDGLPLALELAAARLDALSLPLLVRLLQERLQLLASPASDAPERQHSLEAAITWSYELLSAEEQRLFRHLGVFRARVATSAVSAVLGGANPDTVLGGLVSLAEKSLVVREPGADDEEVEDQHGLPTFRVLQTLREYARDQLERAGELEAAERAHAQYFLSLAERAESLLRGREQRDWFLRLEREHENLRTALRRLLDHADAAERKGGLRLAAAMGYFWWLRGYHTEGARWLEEALASAALVDESDPPEAAVRTKALCWAGALLIMHGDLVRARSRLEEAQLLAQQQHDPAGIALALTFLGQRAVLGDDKAEAVSLLQEAVCIARRLGEPYLLSYALFFLGQATFARGDVMDAAGHYAEALSLCSAAGDSRVAAAVYVELGVISGQRGDLRDALAHLRAALEASVSLRDRWLLSLGAQAALAVVGSLGDPIGCARLQGAAEALRQTTGGGRVPWEPADVDWSAPMYRPLQEGEWASAYREGQHLPFGEVAALTLTLLDEGARTQAATHLEPTAEPTHATGTAQGATACGESCENRLTEREQEVLRLVAQGLGNKAIAKQLVISSSTVNYHLIQIFNKLGVDTRAQAVALAMQQGLL